MIEVPSRISALIQRLENGDEPTAGELRRIANLQALDLAKAGEDFMREACLEEERQTEALRQVATL